MSDVVYHWCNRPIHYEFYTVYMPFIYTHQFTTFLIKKAVQGFLLYNEFDQNITKESDPVPQTYYTMKKL